MFHIPPTFMFQQKFLFQFWNECLEHKVRNPGFHILSIVWVHSPVEFVGGILQTFSQKKEQEQNEDFWHRSVGAGTI